MQAPRIDDINDQPDSSHERDIMHRILIRTLATATLAGAFLAPSLGHASATHSGSTVNVTPNNFMRAFPAHLPAGALTLRLTTPGKRDLTSVNLAQLHPGVSNATVARLMRAGQLFKVAAMVQLIGGVDSLHNATSVGLFNLSAGTYAVYSLDDLTRQKNPSSPVTFVTVTGNGGPAPNSVGLVKAVDFHFRGPATLPAGFDTLQFTNSGHEPHEMILAGIAPGKTMADVKMALMQNGPPPSWVRSVGGWGVLSPGSSMWPRVYLRSGNYVLLCFVPDSFSYPGHKATNKPHFMLGMVRIIHVK